MFWRGALLSRNMWFAAENVVLMGNPYVLEGSSPAENVVQVAKWTTYSAKRPGFGKKAYFQRVKPPKIWSNWYFSSVTCKTYTFWKKLSQNGHSSPQQWSDRSTDAYMGSQLPTRWSNKKSKCKQQRSSSWATNYPHLGEISQKKHVFLDAFPKAFSWQHAQ